MCAIDHSVTDWSSRDLEQAQSNHWHKTTSLLASKLRPPDLSRMVFICWELVDQRFIYCYDLLCSSTANLKHTDQSHMESFQLLCAVCQLMRPSFILDLISVWYPPQNTSQQKTSRQSSKRKRDWMVWRIVWLHEVVDSRPWHCQSAFEMAHSCESPYSGFVRCNILRDITGYEVRRVFMRSVVQSGFSHQIRMSIGTIFSTFDSQYAY